MMERSNIHLDFDSNSTQQKQRNVYVSHRSQIQFEDEDLAVYIRFH